MTKTVQGLLRRILRSISGKDGSTRDRKRLSWQDPFQPGTSDLPWITNLHSSRRHGIVGLFTWALVKAWCGSFMSHRLLCQKWLGNEGGKKDLGFMIGQSFTTKHGI